MEARTPAAPMPAAPTPWAIGDAVTVRAFRLAGLAGRVVATAAEAREAMGLARAAGVTLVVATERAAALLREGDTTADRAMLPVLVVVPAAVGPPAAPSVADRLARRVRQVLGLPAEPSSGPGGA